MLQQHRQRCYLHMFYGFLYMNVELQILLNLVKRYNSLCTRLKSTGRHVQCGSHNVTYHLTQVNALRLTPDRPARRTEG